MLRFCVILISLSFFTLSAATQIPQTLRKVGVSENLGTFLKFENLNLLNSDGEKFNISSLFLNGRSKVFYFGYYTCPMLCHFVAKGVEDAVKASSLRLGSEYDVIMMSLNPYEDVTSAKKFRKKYTSTLSRAHDSNSWYFLMGDVDSIISLTSQFGFSYYYVADSNDFAHSAVIMILTPEAQISRYLYGVTYSPSDFKLSLLEASDERVVSTLNKLLLFCYSYDPQSKKYVLFAKNLMKLGGVLTIFVILFMMFMFNRSAKKFK